MRCLHCHAEIADDALVLLVRNIGFLARTVLFALRLARRHFESAIAGARRLGISFVLAVGLFNLGRLYVTKGRRREADTCFDEARKAAAAIRVPSLCERIDAARRSSPA